MNSIDPEIKKRIEFNKQQALERLAQAKARQQASTSNSENRSSGNRFTPYQARPQPNNVLNPVTNNSVATPQVPHNNLKAPSSMANSNIRFDPFRGTRNVRTNPWQAEYNPVQHKHRMNETPELYKPRPKHIPRPGTSNQPSTSAGTSKKDFKVIVEVMNETRFLIRSVYDEVVINELRKLPSKSWNPTTKVWSFTLNDYKPFITIMDTNFKDTHNIKVDNRIPDFVLKILLRPTPPIDNECLQQIDPKLRDTLLPFQKEGVAFGISRNGRVMICDDMGLGKTRQALGIASFYRQNGATLIVTNASTREFWQDEILKVLDVRERDVRIMPGFIKEAEFVICSYHGLDQYNKELAEKKFEIVIFDESHHLKNPKANQTKHAQKIAKAARNIIMLSGTPALSRPSELYTQLEMLEPNFATFFQYGVRFCNGRQTNYGFDATGCSNMTELEIILKKKFMIRRIKSDVFDQLENKHRECIMLKNLKLTEDQQNDNEQFKSQMADEKYEREVLIHWFTSTASIKARGVCKFLEKLLRTTDEKIIVFGHHAIMLNHISAMLERRDISHIRIDGSTVGEKRSERVQNFQNNENIRVAVLSTIAANAGITLTAASIVVFCELEFNPSTIIQGEARAHRIGQTSQVKVYFLLAPGTADDKIWQMLTQKQTNLGKAGLVDNIEYLSNTMKVSNFDCQKEIDDASEEKDEPDSSSDTFYSCNTKVSQEPQEDTKQSLELTAEELEELRRVEEMLDDDF